MYLLKSINVQWLFYAGLALIAAVAAAWTNSVVGYAVALGFTLLAADTLHATLRWHHDYRVPRLIAFKEAAEARWERFASPVLFMQTASRRFQLARPCGLDFFEIFDQKGNLVGIEQEIDWNMSNDNPADDHPSNVEVIEKSPEKPYRLSWLARWRSRDAIEQAQAYEERKAQL